MTKVPKSRNLYKTPFSKAYWRDAALELKDTKMLVFAALMIALRVALKLVYIPLAPNLKINTAFIANAMGAMVFGPVVGIVAAVASDVLGVLLSGDTYFLPFVLTEIAGSLIFALFLYRVKLTPTRVMLSRFCICLFVNILLQTPLMMLYYQIMMGGKLYVLTVPHILKNLFMFPIESVVLTLFLRFVMPITRRAKLTYSSDQEMKFTSKQIITLVVLFVVGVSSAVGYLYYRYNTSSRSADYTTEERVSANHAMAEVVLDNTDQWDQEQVVCIVDSAYRGLFAAETSYNVSVYVVDQEAFAAGQADNEKYTMDTLWAYSKSGPSKDKYQSLVKVASAEIIKNEKTGEILKCEVK